MSLQFYSKYQVNCHIYANSVSPGNPDLRPKRGNTVASRILGYRINHRGIIPETDQPSILMQIILQH